MLQIDTAREAAAVTRLTLQADGWAPALALLFTREFPFDLKARVMILASSTFSPGGPIPKPCTCDGKDRSPALAWSEIPVDTRSFGLICDDPDAPRGTWVHWVLFNLPADAVELSEGVPGAPELPSGARQGVNDGAKIGYSGPCPPPGRPHRYFFRLYALDCLLNLSPGVTRSDLDQAMTGHVLAEAVVMGTYGR